MLAEENPRASSGQLPTQASPAESTDVAMEDVVAVEHQHDNDSESMPALFMDGLPSNFSENPQLSAIASLLTSSETTVHQQRDNNSGGGKFRARRQGSCRRSDQQQVSSPYSKRMEHPNTRTSRRRNASSTPLRSNVRRHRKEADRVIEEQSPTSSPESTTMSELALYMKLWKPTTMSADDVER